MLKYFRRRFFKLITGYTWLRSGSYDYAYKYSYLTSSAYWNVAYPARLLAVRPATHKAASPWRTRTDFSKQRIPVVLPSEISKRIATRLRARASFATLYRKFFIVIKNFHKNRGFLCRG